MSLEWMVYMANHHNALLWLYFKELDMAKYCKLVDGFVANDFDCEQCDQCVVKDK